MERPRERGQVIVTAMDRPAMQYALREAPPAATPSGARFERPAPALWLWLFLLILLLVAVFALLAL